MVCFLSHDSWCSRRQTSHRLAGVEVCRKKQGNVYALCFLPSKWTQGFGIFLKIKQNKMFNEPFSKLSLIPLKATSSYNQREHICTGFSCVLFSLVRFLWRLPKSMHKCKPKPAYSRETPAAFSVLPVTYMQDCSLAVPLIANNKS